ncbi:hypothetical protein HDU98_000543 [Podochytrium sp. JEL0797]|nr:hypothetical protein HDU98_000543 [Podochytrium sp. JEL0797]
MSNDTILVPQAIPSMTNIQYLAVGIGEGMAFQIIIAGSTGILWHNWRQLKHIHYIMLTFNTIAIPVRILQCLALYAFQGQHACHYNFFVENAVCHFFDISFDCFLLYKSYIVSGYNKWVRAFIAICFVNRLVWTVLDIPKSHGNWDATTQTCNYYDDPITGLTWNLSDIFMDLASTFISVYFCWGQLTSNFNQIAKVIVTDNILRSVVTCAINIYIIFSGYYVTNPFWGYFIYVIRDWIYVFSLNAELFWKEERERSFNAARPSFEDRVSGGKGVFSKDTERTKSLK